MLRNMELFVDYMHVILTSILTNSSHYFFVIAQLHDESKRTSPPSSTGQRGEHDRNFTHVEFCHRNNGNDITYFVVTIRLRHGTFIKKDDLTSECFCAFLILGNPSCDPTIFATNPVLPSFKRKRRHNFGQRCFSSEWIKSLHGLLALCPAYCHRSVSCCF